VLQLAEILLPHNELVSTRIGFPDAILAERQCLIVQVTPKTVEPASPAPFATFRAAVAVAHCFHDGKNFARDLPFLAPGLRITRIASKVVAAAPSETPPIRNVALLCEDSSVSCMASG